MYDSVVVEIGNSGEGCSNQIGSIRLVVITFTTDTVKEFTAKGKVSYKVDYDQLA